MKTILNLEYLAILIFGIFAFYLSGISLWWFLLLFLTPDISMLGYLISPKWGAFMYNIAHHLGLGIGFFIYGYFYMNTTCLAIAGVILAHSAFDRILGYGLKYNRDFHETHLGKIGKNKSN